MNYRILLLLCFLFITSCSRKEDAGFTQAQFNDVLKNTVAVRSINPSDTVFSDLDFFRTFVGDAAVVLLGEQSHGDGSTFLAKTRLIKFLHQEMGFTLLAFESGMFETELAHRFIAGGMPVNQALEHSVFTIWTQSKQCQDLLRYIQDTRNTGSPLMVTGFDMQSSGPWGRDSLLPALTRTIPQFINDSSRHWSAITAVLDTLKKSQKRFKEIDSLSRRRFFRSMDTVLHALANYPKNADEQQYWSQQLRSLKTYINFLWNIDMDHPDPAVFNLRDEQMADNLLWLARNRYAGKKIIVWAASSHISKNRHEIVNRNDPDQRMIPMGHHLWKAMGDSLRIVGFTAYHGRVGARGRQPWDLAAAQRGTLEDAFFRTGYEYAFLNFRSVAEGSWLRDTVRARPYGYTTMNARWARMMDGMFYCKTMIPSDKVRED